MKTKKNHPPLVQQPINSFWFSMIPVIGEIEQVIRNVAAKKAAQRQANKPKVHNFIGSAG